jgi:hypothetical protein
MTQSAGVSRNTMHPLAMGWLLETALLNIRRDGRGASQDEAPSRGWTPVPLAAIVLVGALVIVSIAIGVTPAAGWVAFGVSLVTAVTGCALVLVARKRGLRALAWVGGGIAILAAWTVIATAGIFSPDTERWIAFGSGLGYFVEALGALGVYELASSRVVHVLEVREDPRTRLARGL